MGDNAVVGHCRPRTAVRDPDFDAPKQSVSADIKTRSDSERSHFNRFK
jgi:hypothetical protein